MSDRLEEILRNDAQLALRDDGFTARVTGALPAPAPRSRRWLQPALILGSALAGSVLAAMLAPVDANVAQGFMDLAQLKGFTPAAIAGIAMAAVLLISAVVLAAETD
jgi:hypothetical protein